LIYDIHRIIDLLFSQAGISSQEKCVVHDAVGVGKKPGQLPIFPPGKKGVVPHFSCGGKAVGVNYPKNRL
jgi:hypothetical protein